MNTKFTEPCPICKNPVTFTQEDSWCTPLGYCSTCNKHLYVKFDLLIGKIKINIFEYEKE